MLKVRKEKHNILFIMFMFMFIYYPPIMNINMLHIVAIISYGYLIFHYSALIGSNILNRISGAILILILACFYGTIICVFNNSMLSNIVFLYQFLFEVIPTSVASALYMKKRDYTLGDSLDLLIILGVIQGIIAVITFIFPEAQQILVQRAIDYGFNATKYSTFLDRRYYGLSYNLVTYVPVFQSFLAIISLKLVLDKSKVYLVPIPLLIFSAVINGRSSIIIIMIGLLLILFEQIVNMKFMRMIKLSVVFMIILSLSSFLLKRLEWISYRAYTWITDGIKEILLFLTERNMEGTFFSTLSSWKTTLPKGFKFIFGAGELSIGGNSFFVATDIGYINYLWLGGIVLFVILHIYYGNMLVGMYQVGRKKGGELVVFYSLFLIAICFVFNIKMPIFLLNEVSIVMILSYVTIKIL